MEVVILIKKHFKIIFVTSIVVIFDIAYIFTWLELILQEPLRITGLILISKQFRKQAETQLTHTRKNVPGVPQQ